LKRVTDVKFVLIYAGDHYLFFFFSEFISEEIVTKLNKILI